MAITIAAALKRDKLLAEAMRAFKARVIPILQFARKFNDTPLEGTNIIQVPYFPLATGASTDFVPANGYDTANAQAIQTKPVTINKRKYRMVSFTSENYARQPFLSLAPLMKLEGEKLADDVIADVFTGVTAANFPGTTLAAMAASAFDLDDCTDLRELCTKAEWPKSGRALVLDTSFAKFLTRDARLGNQNSGSNAQVTEGFPDFRVAGFDGYEVGNLPANGAEKIAGMAIYPSAMFVGFSPIAPHPTLSKTLVEYKVITDPDTGLSLEYRAFGDAKMDTVFEVIECNYGFAVGEAAALKRITTP